MRMNAKAMILIVTVFLCVLGGVAFIEEEDAVTEYPVTVYYHPNATIVFDGVTVTYPNNAEPYGYGDPITIVATLAAGYSFDHWYGNNITEGEDWSADSSSPYISISGNVVTYTTWCYGEEEYTLYLSGGVTPTYSITFVNRDHDYGSLSTYLISNVPYGAHWSASSKTFTILNSNPFVYSKCTATANAKSGPYQYAFDGWSYTGTGTVTDDMTVTAYFSRSTAEYTVTFASSGNGSVSPSTISHVPYGTAITTSGKTVTINGTTATATPHAATTYYNYYFDSWSGATGTVTGNLTITANFTQAPKNFPVTVYYHPNATIYVDYEEVPQAGWADETAYGGLIHLSATIDEGYTFDYWYGNNITEGEDWRATSGSAGVTVNGQFVTYETYCYGEEEYTLYLTGGTPATYTISFVASPAAYGALSTASVEAEYGDIWSIDGSGFRLNGGVVTWALPNPTSGGYQYAFDGWSRSGSGTITEDTTVTAYFTRSAVTPSDVTYWCNELYNGVVEIAFHYPSGSNTTHVMTMDLCSPLIISEQNVTWYQTGYSLEVSSTYSSSSGAEITATMKYNGTNVGTSAASVGLWSTFILNINTTNGSVVFYPIDRFTDFTTYNVMQTPTTIFTWETPASTTIYEILHTETGTGSHTARFAVVNTSTFLNTFGVVLNDPSINVGAYYPQYEAMMVSLTSFAVLGDSMTVNGFTWQVEGAGISVTYTTDDDGVHHAAASPGISTETRNFTLSNIDIIWDGETAQIVFNNDKFTLDLGGYTSESFSFSGLWYFTATLSEPYTATQTVVTGEWDYLMDIDKNVLLFVFLGILLLAGMFCHLKFKLKWLDGAVVVIALVVAFAIMG